MRNEMHFQLKEHHRLVQCSRFLLARDQKYLCLLEAGESGRMFSSQIPDELKLVAHPVGITGQEYKQWQQRVLALDPQMLALQVLDQVYVTVYIASRKHKHVRQAIRALIVTILLGLALYVLSQLTS